VTVLIELVSLSPFGCCRSLTPKESLFPRKTCGLLVSLPKMSVAALRKQVVVSSPIPLFPWRSILPGMLFMRGSGGRRFYSSNFSIKPPDFCFFSVERSVETCGTAFCASLERLDFFSSLGERGFPASCNFYLVNVTRDLFFFSPFCSRP